MFNKNWVRGMFVYMLIATLLSAVLPVNIVYARDARSAEASRSEASSGREVHEIRDVRDNRLAPSTQNTRLSRDLLPEDAIEDAFDSERIDPLDLNLHDDPRSDEPTGDPFGTGRPDTSDPLDIEIPDDLEPDPRDDGGDDKGGEDEEEPPPGYVGADYWGDKDDTGINQSKYDEWANGEIPHLEIDKSSGLASYEYPINIPLGRNGLQPKLNLTYSSGTKDNFNIFGYGWKLDTGYVMRRGKYGRNRLYEENDFVLNIFGAQKTLKAINLTDDKHGEYAAEIENDFMQIQFLNNDSWLVTDENGTQFTFGLDSSSRQDDTGDISKISKWMLEEVRDSNDNFIRFTYFKDSGQIYPDKIFYTGHGKEDGIFEILFSRELRLDDLKANHNQFELQNRYRVNSIEVKINGIKHRSYDLDYTIGGNGLRSLLNKITENAYDKNANKLSLPSTEFDYNKSNIAWELDDDWTFPINFVSNNIGQGVRMVDVNGDALVDVVKSVNGSLNKVWINNGSGWDLDEDWTLPVNLIWIYGGANDYGVRFVDVNGDAFIDIVQSNTSSNKIWINNGKGWNLDTNWQIPLNIVTSFDGTDLGVRFVDVNGDGLVDLVKSKTGDSPSVWINNGNGWDLNKDWEVPAAFVHIYGNAQDLGVRFVDINGDGLIDLVRSLSQSSNSTNQVYINNGKSWDLDENYIIPTPISKSNAGEQGVRFIDVNGDGLTDLVKGEGGYNSLTKAIYLNNGKEWILQDAELPITIVGTIGYTDDIGVRLNDVNGDGLVDFVFATQYAKKVYINKTSSDHASADDLLINVKESKGSESQVSYLPSTYYKGPDGDLLNPYTPLVLHTVKEVSTNDGLGNISEEEYVYSGGKFYVDGEDVYRNTFAGFNEVKSIDAEDNVLKSFFHQGEGSDYHKIGRPESVEQYDSNGNLYSKNINQWETVDLGDGRAFVKLTEQIEQSYDGTGTHKDKAIAYEYDDTNGNLLKEIDYGEVQSDGSSFSDIGSDKRTTIKTYASNPNNEVLSALSSEKLLDNAGNKVAERRYYYDNQSLGSINAEGNLTKSENWLDTWNSYLASISSYDAYGLVKSSTNPRGYTTDFDYDVHNLYAEKITNAKGQSSNFEYNLYTGAITKQTDANGIIALNEFDALNRLKKQKISSIDDKNSLVLRNEYLYNDYLMPRKVEVRNYTNGGDYVASTEHRNGLGQVIQKRREAEGGKYLVKGFKYDKRGNLKSDHLEHFAGGSLGYHSSQIGSIKNSYQYDALNRVKKISNVFGSTLYNYSPWQKTLTDANGNQKNYSYDARGNLTQVKEFNGPETYTTNYAYSPLNKLKKITDAKGNVRVLNYDSLARLKSQQDLHHPSDDTFAVWHYEYDENGNLKKLNKQEQGNEAIVYNYDELDRITSEDFEGQNGVEVSYSYDSANNGVGRLASISKEGFSAEYAYDNQANLHEETKNVHGNSFTSSYEYNLQGQNEETTLPDGSVARNKYNNAGLLEKVQFKETVAGSFKDLVYNYDYSPLGQLAKVQYGNGAVTTNTYSTSKLYRLTNKKTTAKKYFADPETVQVHEGVAKTPLTLVEAGTASIKAMGGAKDGSVKAKAASWSEILKDVNNDLELNTAGNLKVGSKSVENDSSNTRAILQFDVSSIPNQARVTEATLYLNPSSSLGNLENNLVITALREDFSGDGGTDIVSEDYLKFTDMLIAEPIDDNFNGQATVGFKLSKTGLELLKNSELHMGLRTTFDYKEEEDGPTAQEYEIEFVSADTNEELAPYLEVSYFTFKEQKGYHEFGPEESAEVLAQDIDYYYDAVGNVTKIVDQSKTDAAKTIEYKYDDLYRLVQVDAHNSFNNDNYVYNYDYDALGNMLNNPTLTALSYGENATSPYANPHAATKIGWQNLEYDKNGNLLNDGSRFMAWDYNDRLASVDKNGSVNSFNYDHTGQRISKNGDLYPFSFYEVEEDGTIVRRIGDFTVESGGDGNGMGGVDASEMREYAMVKDHLGGSSLMINEDGIIAQIMDYYPYGELRLEQKWDNFDEKKKFTGHELDDETGLHYANARYYDAAFGRFASLDPASLNSPERFLSDPQQLNFYAYARNNPVKYVDPSGESIFVPNFFNTNVQFESDIVDESGNPASSPSDLSYNNFTGSFESVGQIQERNSCSNCSAGEKTAASIVTGLLGGGGNIAVKGLGYVKGGINALRKGQEKGFKNRIQTKDLNPKKSIVNRSNNILRSEQKSIRSYEKLIKRHQNYIKNPKTKVKDFYNRDIRYQQGLINHWHKEINTFKNNIKKIIKKTKK